MSRTCVTILALLFGVTFVIADESPATKLDAIKKSVKDAEDAFRKLYTDAKDDPKQTKAIQDANETFNKAQTAGLTAAVELAKADPKSEAGFAALEWVLTTPRSYYLPMGKPALELAIEHHAANPKIGKIIAWTGYYSRQESAETYAPTFRLIHLVAEKNPDRAARGQAAMALAWQAGIRHAVAEFKKDSDAEALAAKAEQAFESVIKDYADCPRLMREGQRTLGEEAKQELFELRHLRVGKPAPDIEGEDLDGKRFKLSDYRGKVTAVVFWASWCGPCMQMVPHERKLVARLKDQPFVMIGVNGDDDRTKAREVTVKEDMNWRSFWNGDKGPDGPLSRAWNVRGWPTTYVLDHKGIIRAKNVRGESMDKAIDELLAEMK